MRLLLLAMVLVALLLLLALQLKLNLRQRNIKPISACRLQTIRQYILADAIRHLILADSAHLTSQYP